MIKDQNQYSSHMGENTQPKKDGNALHNFTKANCNVVFEK